MPWNPAFYGIYEARQPSLEVYRYVENHFERLAPNEQNHYPIPQMGVELGIWEGQFLNYPPQAWLRWWDHSGQLLLTGKEEAKQERLKRQQLSDRLRTLTPEQLHSLGIDPNLLT
jgi:hypothetical protein